MKKYLLIFTGTLFIGLGIIGIFIPLLPTTPFILLAAACYAKSSEKFYNKLINSKLLGKHLKNYREGKGIPIKIKVYAIFLLWAAILTSLFLFTKLLLVKILLIVIAIAVTIHISLILPKKK